MMDIQNRKYAGFMMAFVVGFLSSCTVFSPPKANLPSREGIIPGETITVQGHQNIYGVAQQYHVSMRDLIVLNDVKAPFVLRPGDKLILPAGHAGEEGSAPASITPPGEAAAGAVEETTLPPVQSSALPPVQAAASQTQYANAPKPVSSTPSAEALTTPSPTKSVATTAAQPPSQQAMAAAPPEVQVPEEAPAFVWPVQGPVLSGFGPKGQGLNNDGVNIGAPKGAPVVAAAPGIVVYAGNEMKGFGNLILIRHQGGWVTAYAHLDRTLVNKDAVVAAGDEIGTVGATGNVPSPQLHFETRYQGKPVDPAGVVKSQ
jgi:murein DD-endopeptidase MepM/ murein hydrolase activator NlpD